MNPGAMQAMAGAADHASGDPDAEPSTDIELDFPAAGKVTETDISLVADKPAESDVIDFNIELPEMDKAPAAPPKQTAAQSEEEPLDFKIDLHDVNLDLDDNAQAGAQAGGGKDAHWHDVQTKFDLAKAYQEMGENSDAKAILQEVIKEGDDKQQAEAKELLKKLG
jgi:pilus assembly protein FimV